MNRNRRLMVAIVSFIVVAALCSATWLWLDLRITLAPLSQHEQAVARWDTAQIENYHIIVRAQETFRTSGVYEITVRSGEIESAVLYSIGAYRYDPNPAGFEVDNTQAAAYTVDAMLTRAERLATELLWLNLHTPSTSHIVYHPEQGYPLRYVENTCGFLATDTIAACSLEMEVLAFDVLEASIQ